MNNRLIVKKSNSTDDIPIKYGVVEITIGNAATNTYLVLQTIDVGWDTLAHYEDWKAGKSPSGDYPYPTGRDVTGIQGTIGAIEVQPLDTGVGQVLVAYKPFTPSMDRHA